MDGIWIKHPKSKEIFSFNQLGVEEVSDTFELEVDTNKMPASGPMNNQGFDGNGIGKVVKFNGHLFDTDTSVTNINDIRSKLIMKYWLESIPSGFNAIPCEFSVPFSEKAIRNSSGTTEFYDSVSNSTVNLQGEFVNIKGRIIELNVTEVKGVPEKYEFSIALWICGF